MQRSRTWLEKTDPTLYHWLLRNNRALLDEVYPRANVKWTDEMIHEEAKKYEIRAAFQKGSKGAYQGAHKRGILDQVCSHMSAALTYWTDEMIVAEAKKYETRMAFTKGSRAAYAAAQKRGIIDQVCSHMGRPIIRCTESGREFPSMVAAAAAVNRSHSSLSRAIKRGQRCGGFHCEYADTVEITLAATSRPIP